MRSLWRHQLGFWLSSVVVLLCFLPTTTWADTESLSSSSSCTVQLPSSSSSLSCAEFAASHSADVEWNEVDQELVCRYAGVDPKASSCFNVTLSTSTNNNNNDVRLTCRNRACHYATVHALARVECTDQACHFATIRQTTQHAVTCGRTTEPPLSLSSQQQQVSPHERQNAAASTTTSSSSWMAAIRNDDDSNNNNNDSSACRHATLVNNRWLHCWGTAACGHATVVATHHAPQTHVSCVGTAACAHASLYAMPITSTTTMNLDNTAQQQQEQSPMAVASDNNNTTTTTTTSSDTMTTTTVTTTTVVPGRRWLTCRGFGACGHATVERVDRVECQSPGACAMVQIKASRGVTCLQDGACQEAHISNTDLVECGSPHACRAASLHHVPQAVCTTDETASSTSTTTTTTTTTSVNALAEPRPLRGSETAMTTTHSLSCLADVFMYNTNMANDNGKNVATLVVAVVLTLVFCCVWYMAFF